MKDHFGTPIKLGDRVIYCSMGRYYTIGVVTFIHAHKIQITIEKELYSNVGTVRNVNPLNVVIYE